MRSKTDYPHSVIELDFGCTKTGCRGITENLNRLNVLFASANWLQRAYSVAGMECESTLNRQELAEAAPWRSTRLLLKSSRMAGLMLGPKTITISASQASSRRVPTLYPPTHVLMRWRPKYPRNSGNLLLQQFRKKGYRYNSPFERSGDWQRIVRLTFTESDLLIVW